MFGESLRKGQLDTVTKSILLSSLNIDVFNRVYSLTNAHDIWTSLIEIHEGIKNVKNKKISYASN